MDTNLTTHYTAIQTSRSRLSAQAERGWLTDQAAAARPARSRAAAVRRWVGMTLVLIGERVQGTARPVFDPARADQSPAAFQDA